MKRNEKQDYFLYVKGQLISVSSEVYKEFYRIRRHEKYLEELDEFYGLLHYDSWDNTKGKGIDYIADKDANTQIEALREIEKKTIMEAIHHLDSMEKWLVKVIFYEEKTEKEIAEILGISQQMVNKKKQKVLKKIKKFLKKGC